jgi:hypothetical protein
LAFELEAALEIALGLPQGHRLAPVHTARVRLVDHRLHVLSFLPLNLWAPWSVGMSDRMKAKTKDFCRS